MKPNQIHHTTEREKLQWGCCTKIAVETHKSMPPEKSGGIDLLAS